MPGLAAGYEKRLRALPPRLANRVLVESRRAAPVKTRRTQDSLRTQGSWQAGLVTVVISSNRISVITTNFGARPHPIFPRPGKKFLAFQWPKVAGDPRFRRLPDGRVLLPRVNHPGNVGTRWLSKTLRRWPEFIREDLRRPRVG